MDQHRKYIGSTSLQDSTGQQVGVTNNALDVNVTGGDIIIDNVSVNVNTDAFSASPDSILSVGSEDATITGIRHVLRVDSTGSVATTATPAGTTTNTYGYASSVPANVLTTVVSYTAIIPARLRFVSASGTNVATYEVVVNGGIQSKKYVGFAGPLSADFQFMDGIVLVPSDTVLVRVMHDRPTNGDFNANIVVTEG